jgi:Xaa-Pro aminopeptidase
MELGELLDGENKMNISDTELHAHRRAQLVARDTLIAIQSEIKPGATEATLANACRRLMDAAGATGYWWYTTPAYVLSGENLRLSVEGDAYVAGEVAIGADGMITIDLHPEIDGRWGDCARSYFLRDGNVVTAEAAGYEEADGMATEAALHSLFQAKARPDMTFQELHSLVFREVASRGYENLDFLGNFGHSVGADVAHRAFIDGNCNQRLGSSSLLTFEPHIARPGRPLAFKHEEIYRFDETGTLCLL